MLAAPAPPGSGAFLLLAIITIVFFIGLLAWLFRPGASARYARAARLPLEDERPLRFWRLFGGRGR